MRANAEEQMPRTCQGGRRRETRKNSGESDRYSELSKMGGFHPMGWWKQNIFPHEKNNVTMKLGGARDPGNTPSR